MDARKLLAVINEVSAQGCDAYGFAVAVAEAVKQAAAAEAVGFIEANPEATAADLLAHLAATE